MLPSPDDDPPCLLKSPVGPLVSLSVARNFLRPKCRVLAGWPKVIGTAVPVAPINEDGDLLPSKHEISREPFAKKRPSVDAVPKSSGMH